MEKIVAGDPVTRSADFVDDNLERLKALFPEAFTEGKVDFEVLRQLLGDAVDEREQKYGLNWHGKRRARQLSLTPSIGTLRPCPEDSVDWNTTQNLMIEGDNLEVLKLLQKSYTGKVKLIYIDPPYNTGKDFVYPDNYRDNIRNYLELTGQIDGENRKLSSNADASGRFHTDWLNMMYPRLRVARTLLCDQGAIFVSCDDVEANNLRALLDEIFGSENFIAQFVWKSRQFTDARAVTNVSTDHEYLVAYAKNTGYSVRGISRDETKFSNPDNDNRGPWMSRSLLGLATRDQRPNLHYEIIDPATNRRFLPSSSTGWRYSREKMDQLIADNCILFPKKASGRPREKKFRKDMQAEYIAFRSIIDGVHTANGTQEIRDLFSNTVFVFPKPTELIAKVIEQATSSNDIVVDFFAGSGTTGHATMLQNSKDGGSRRYILIQLPEVLSPTNREEKAAADYCTDHGLPLSIAELTKERLRRAARKVNDEATEYSGDLGFRVFKLGTSNIRTWDPKPDDLEGALLSGLDHIEPGRTEQDILYELLLKLGLDLCVHIDTRTIAGKTVHSVGAGTLIVCLDETISRDDAEPLALGIADWHDALAPAGECTVVFRDSAFADDVAKTNLAETLKQRGLGNVRSL